MAVIVSKGIVVPSYAPPVGTTWLYENNGTFEVPADGIYQVEMHGGGGGGGGGAYSEYTGWWYGCGGSGSGTLKKLTLTKDETYAIIIGTGGDGGSIGYQSRAGRGSNGGITKFGTYSIAGGYGSQGGSASAPTHGDSVGQASGELATVGKAYNTDNSAAGGYGNKNNTAQTYGNGGAGGYGPNPGSAGQPGAVIITFMGVA